MDPSYASGQFVVDQLQIRAPPRNELQWWDYLQDMTAQMLRIAHCQQTQLSGMNILVDSRVERGGLPAGAGLGSSSALLNAFGLVCGCSSQPRIKLTASQLATAAMYSENSLGFPSGLQDPMGSIGGELGWRDRHCGAVLIDPLPRQRAGEPYVVTRTLPLASTVKLLLVHTGVPREPSAWREFNIRADEAKLSSWLLAHWLSERYPAFFSDPERIINAYPDLTEPENTLYPPFWRPFYFTIDELRRVGLSVSTIELDELTERLPVSTDRAKMTTIGMSGEVFDQLTTGSRIAGETLDTRLLNLRGSFRHVTTEQARVLRAIAAVESGNMRELGNLQKEIFSSLDLNYRVVSPTAKALTADASKMPGVLAARPLGGVWGCIVAIWLSEDAPVETLMEAIRTAIYHYRDVRRSEVLLIPTTPGADAGIIFPYF